MKKVELSLYKEDAQKVRDILWQACYPTNLDEDLLGVILEIDIQLPVAVTKKEMQEFFQKYADRMKLDVPRKDDE